MVTLIAYLGLDLKIPRPLLWSPHEENGGVQSSSLATEGSSAAMYKV